MSKLIRISIIYTYCYISKSNVDETCGRPDLTISPFFMMTNAYLHGIIMDISFLHLSFVISMHCICISHCIVIHLHLACFCSANCIHSIFIIHMLCSLMHDPCIFLGKTKKKEQKKVTMKHGSLHHILSYMCWVP